MGAQPGVTVSVVGAVNEPVVLRCAATAGLEELVARAGGAVDDDWVPVAVAPGGRLVARAATLAEAGAPSVLLVLPARHAWVRRLRTSVGDWLWRAASARVCEGCRACSDACPVGLPAHALVATLAVARDDGSASRRAGAAAFAACTGCGVCDAACPASLSPGRLAVDVRERLAAGGVTAGATTLRAGIDRALLTLRLGLGAYNRPPALRYRTMKWMGGLVFLTIGLGCLVAGGYVWRAQARFAATAAPPTAWSWTTSIAGHRRAAASAPAVEFRVPGGRTLRIVGSVGSSSPAYQRGAHVQLFFNPAHPEQAPIDSFTERWLGQLILLLVGVVFTPLGLALVVARLRVAALRRWLVRHGTRVQARFGGVERDAKPARQRTQSVAHRLRMDGSDNAQGVHVSQRVGLVRSGAVHPRRSRRLDQPGRSDAARGRLIVPAPSPSLNFALSLDEVPAVTVERAAPCRNGAQ